MSRNPRGYPEVDKSLRQLSFQLNSSYKSRKKYRPVTHNRVNFESFQYDFSLEHGIKEVFEKERKESQIVENEPEEEPEAEKPKRVAPPIPPRPMLETQKSDIVDQADSGVSSGGENGSTELPPSEIPEQQTSYPNYSQLLMPTTNSQNITARSIPKPNATVLDIFDYSRDDPFERVQMNALDDMAELREVLEKSQTPPSETKFRPQPKPRNLAKPTTSAPDTYVSEIQSILDARQSKNQLEKKQNFSKSAMAAMNSLPVIETPEKKTKPPPRPEPTYRFPPESAEMAQMLLEMGYDKFMIAKAISLFGNDEDKCIDYLSAYTELVSGGHSSSVVMSTLSVCEYSLEETKLFLQKSPRYLEMGFDQRAVRKALIRYPNEPQLQLESLMMGRS